MALNANPERSPSTVLQRTGGQTVAGAANVLLGSYLLKRGVSPESVLQLGVLLQAAIGIAGKVLRNVAAEKGWAKWIG